MPEGSCYEEFSSAGISYSKSQNGINAKASDINRDKRELSDLLDGILSTEDNYEERCFIDHASIVNNIDNWEEAQKPVLKYAIDLYLEGLGQPAAGKEELEKVTQIIPNLMKNGAIVVHQDHANKSFVHIMEEDRYKTKTDVFRASKKEMQGGGSYTIAQRIDGSQKILGHMLDENAGSEISCCLVDSVESIPHLVENYTGNYGSIVSVFDTNKVRDSLVYCGGDSMDDLVICNTNNSKIEELYKSNGYHGVAGLVERPTLGAIPCDAAAKLIATMRAGEKIDSVAKYMEVTGKYPEVMITKEARFRKHVSQVVLCPNNGMNKEDLMSLEITKKIKEHKNILWANNQGILEKM